MTEGGQEGGGTPRSGTEGRVRGRDRRRVLRAVLDEARTSGDVVAPWVRVPGVRDHFAGDDDLLRELHHEWLRVLVGRLHHGGVVAGRTPASVRDAYDEAAAAHPTLRGLLDAHAAHPALWDPTAAEHAMLARVAGLAQDSTPAEEAAALGRTLLFQRIPTQRSTLG